MVTVQESDTRKFGPSMKVPPKRKGNFVAGFAACFDVALNESPSEKEGKWRDQFGVHRGS